MIVTVSQARVFSCFRSHPAAPLYKSSVEKEDGGGVAEAPFKYIFMNSCYV